MLVPALASVCLAAAAGMEGRMGRMSRMGVARQTDDRSLCRPRRSHSLGGR